MLYGTVLIALETLLILLNSIHFLTQRPALPLLNFFHKYVGYILTLVREGKDTVIAVQTIKAYGPKQI
jgi:hypothetical protein